MVNYKSKYLAMKLKYINAKNKLKYGGDYYQKWENGLIPRPYKILQKANQKEISLLDIEIIEMNLDINKKHFDIIFRPTIHDITKNENKVIQIYNKKTNSRKIVPISSSYKYYYIIFNFNKLLVLDAGLNNVNNESFVDNYINKINSTEKKWNLAIINKNLNALITLDPLKDCFKFDRQYIDKILIKLNEILQEKCDNLNIKLDNYYNLKNVDILLYEGAKDLPVLCLYKGNNCISSLSFIFSENDANENQTEFEAATHEEHQGKKYYKLLISAAILLLRHIYCNNKIIKYIYAIPAAYESGYLLTKDYYYQFRDFNEEFWTLDKTIDSWDAYVEVQDTESYSIKDIVIEIEKNQKNAMDVFINLTSELGQLKC